MRLVNKVKLNERKSLYFYEWDGEEIVRTVLNNDPHSEWFQWVSARHDLAKRLNDKGAPCLSRTTPV